MSLSFIATQQDMGRKPPSVLHVHAPGAVIVTDELRGKYPSPPLVPLVPAASLRPADPDWRTKKLRAFLDSCGGASGLSLRHVVQELGLEISGSHAARLFRRDTGIGIREYAKRKRLHIAAVHLKGGAQPIKQIAGDLGYRGIQDFARAFRKVFKLSPSEYRELHRRAG